MRLTPILRLFWSTPRPYPSRLLLVKLAAVPLLSTGTAIAALGIERLVAAVTVGADRTTALVLVGVGLLMSELRSPIDTLVSGHMERSAERWTSSTMLDASARSQKLDRLLSHEYHTHAHMARLGAGRGTVLVPDIIARLLGSLLTVGVLGAAISRLDAGLVGLLVGVAIVAVVVEVRFGQQEVALQHATTPHIRLHDYLQQLAFNPTTAAEVKLFGLTAWLKRRSAGLLRDRHRAIDRHAVHRFAGRSGVSTLSVGIAILAVLLTARQVEVESASTLILIVPAVNAAQALGSTIANSWGMGISAWAWLSGYVDFVEQPIDTPREAVETRQGPAPLLSIENVTFAYANNAPVLSDVSLEIRQGESYAIVGPNGGGKTTLLRLLMRLLDPTQGAIFYRGRSIKSIAIEEYRAVFTSIMQDFNRYQLTLRDNIALGDTCIDDSAVSRSLNHFGIDGSDDALDTSLSVQYIEGEEIGKRRDLSGGQWQRVALARALVRSAEIVVLDEPNSALDPLADAELGEQISNSLGGRTTIITSHRLALIAKADRIVVLDKGRIVSQGTHLDLLRECDLYAAMWSAQRPETSEKV